MTKKRRSLQAILIPSFLQSPLTSPTSPSFARSRADSGASPTNDSNYLIPPVVEGEIAQSISAITSPRASPPPSFLLDDDPFANLTAAPSEVAQRLLVVQQSPVKPVDVKSNQPRSPLTSTPFERISMSTPSSPPAVKTPVHSRASSKSVSGRMPVPAHQKPAFAPKPSLPSLDTLSRMNVVLTKKVRRGHVGAGLPFEPWDHPEDVALFSEKHPSTTPTSPSAIFASNLPSVVDRFPETFATSDSPDVESYPSASDPILADEISDSVSKSVLVEPETHSDVSARFINHHEVPSSIDVTVASSDQESVSAASLLLPDTTIPPSRYNDSDPELRCTTDPEAFDSPSTPALSPSNGSLNESLASLSRSASTSSSGSGDYDFGVAPTSRYGNDVIDGGLAPQDSAAGGNSILNSPPAEDDDYFFFPTIGYTSAAAISNWRDDTVHRRESYDDEDLVTSPVTSVYFECLGEPGMLMDSNRHHQLPGGLGGGHASASVRVGDPRFAGDSSEGGIVDGADYDGYRGGGSSGNYYSYSQAPAGGAHGSYGNGWTGGVRRSATGGGAGSGRGNGEDERNLRRPSRPSAFSSATTTTSSSSEVTSEEEDESADETKGLNTSKSSDDDVPLARSIPTALIAQKSIRKQVREERDQRRRERADQATVSRSETRSRQTTLRPAGASGPAVSQGLFSSSQEAAIHATATASASTRPTARPRTQTLPGRTAPPFSPEDLTKKLQDVQVFSSLRHRRGPSSGLNGDVDAYGVLARHSDINAVSEGFVAPPRTTLRPSRSLHRLQGQGRPSEEHRSVPLPVNATMQLQRAKSQSRLRGEDRPTFEDASRVPVPRMSEDQKRLAREPSVRSARSASTRPSVDTDRRPTRPNTADREQRPPVPPLPAAIPELPAPPRQMTQQRVFIGDMQRYNVVEVDDTTSAGDVIEMLESQGSLKGWVGIGEWMVWEVAHDFGMERPVRHYERLSDVQASWNKDKMVNMFVVRLTPLGPLLSRSAIPSSSPTHAGYVEWESKRGKWSKRWLQLREHSLWISKRDNGKDQSLLCSLSNFDAYRFSRPYKSPKPFAFAIKSTDKLSFFENTSDYKHIISCSEKDGKVWMEKILLARSYVLHQERNVLFNPKSYGGQPTIATSGLTRAVTQRRPSQPLVAVANSDLFEPGSLLHRKG
ncbi:hypothetical protein P691DRAFT_755968 [Macrolepiota fuliginosa MF-IS2]|uniref:PH domain-containing protein n=1 Tax=Macrolepiota fuliginosa MF-IS2 TaxID=1400762 RepID=A0A9P6C9A7_9AGAR|nr:hypothetical protein P691DRAFT_755968 [Macrolepiota fuliginosa MF-IS2]